MRDYGSLHTQFWEQPDMLALSLEARLLTRARFGAIFHLAGVAMAPAGIGVPKHPGAQAPASKLVFLCSQFPMGDCAGRGNTLPDPGPGTPTLHGLPSIIGVVVGRCSICPGDCHA